MLASIIHQGNCIRSQLLAVESYLRPVNRTRSKSSDGDVISGLSKTVVEFVGRPAFWKPGYQLKMISCEVYAQKRCGAADSSVELESDLNVEEREGFSGSERDWIASCVGRLFRNRCGK